MTIDGFRTPDKDGLERFSPEFARRFFTSVETLGRSLDVVVEGLANVPPGRALLVANHSFGFDVVFPVAALARRLERRVWVLGEHLWWKVPFVRRMVSALGVVDGTQANVDRLLARDELVLVLPGGMREAMKPRELRYQLLWGRRYGFVRAALRHQAPLVPLACVGGDELFDLVGNSFVRGARWLGRSDLPIPRPARLIAVPHLKPWRFEFGEPVLPPQAVEPGADERVVRRLRRELEGALHELIEDELARRLGIPLGPVGAHEAAERVAPGPRDAGD